MADASVKIRLTAEDAASPKIAGLKKELASLASQGGVAGTVLGGAVAGGVAGLTMAAVQAIPAIAGTVVEMARMGAESTRMEASFERLARGVGSSSGAMLRAMQESSRGTVANADLISAANRAMVLGVADSAEEMAALVEAAIIRGRDLGVSSTQAVNDLVTGIGRMSPLILDNLGIVGAQKSIDDYATSLGKTAEQLTDVEKKQALLNSVLASVKGVTVVEDAASAFERMDTSLANMQSSLGTLFSPAVAAIADAIAAAADSALQFGAIMSGDVTQSVDELDAKLADAKTRLADLQNPALYDQGFAGVQHAIAGVTDEIAMLEQAKAQLLGTTQAATSAAAQFAATQAGMTPAIDAVTKKLLDQAVAARQAIAATAASQSAGLKSTLLGMAGDLGGTGALLQYQDLNAELQKRTELMQSWGYTAEQIEFANAAWIDNTTGALRDQINAYDDLGSTGSRALSGINTAASGLQSTLSGLVSSQISGALSLDGISLPGGPRQDDVNENARRLAAIANEGLIGQDWLGQFAQEAPSTYADLMLKIASGMDAQGAARMLLDQFQQGLRPDLINFDMIKQRVKDQLTSQQAIQEMTADLTQQLMAEMNVSAEQVQGALSQLGLGTGGVADSSAMKQEFLAGLDASGIATGSVAAIATAFKANESSLRTSGGVVGAWWGEGFMTTVGDNVPGQLLEMLTVKLVPFIWAAIRTSQSTTAPEE